MSRSLTRSARRRDHRSTQLGYRSVDLSKGRMPCPVCEAPMELPFDLLFAGLGVTCAQCGAGLSLDPQANRDSIGCVRAFQRDVAVVMEQSR